MAFAYVINKNSSQGTLSDDAGKFLIHVAIGDTLAFSFLGYSTTKIYTHLLKDAAKNSSLTLKVYLRPKATELNSILITSPFITKEEKEYYRRKVDEYHRVVSSPFAIGPTGAGLSIDALYYTFSKRGKELKKLSEIYLQLEIDETREHRLNGELIRVITGNDTLNVKAFWKFCYLPDGFIVNASDYDLYYAVNRCYRQYSETFIRKK